ncbi:MAG: hypothetical protein ABIQ44_07985, partial [Chloroflexia bacterium]
ITEIIAPLGNKPDWSELPPAARRHVQFHWVDTMDGVIRIALASTEVQPAVPVADPEVQSSDMIEIVIPIIGDRASDPVNIVAEGEMPSDQTTASDGSMDSVPGSPASGNVNEQSRGNGSGGKTRRRRPANPAANAEAPSVQAQYSEFLLPQEW